MGRLHCKGQYFCHQLGYHPIKATKTVCELPHAIRYPHYANSCQSCSSHTVRILPLILPRLDSLTCEKRICFHQVFPAALTGQRKEQRLVKQTLGTQDRL